MKHVDVRIYAIGDRIIIDEDIEGGPPVQIVVDGAMSGKIGTLFINMASIASSQTPDPSEPDLDTVTLSTLPR